MDIHELLHTQWRKLLRCFVCWCELFYVLWYLLWLTIILILPPSHYDIIETPYPSIRLGILLLQWSGGHWLQNWNSFGYLMIFAYFRITVFRLAVLSARSEVPSCWYLPSFRPDLLRCYVCDFVRRARPPRPSWVLSPSTVLAVYSLLNLIAVSHDTAFVRGTMRFV